MPWDDLRRMLAKREFVPTLLRYPEDDIRHPLAEAPQFAEALLRYLRGDGEEGVGDRT